MEVCFCQGKEKKKEERVRTRNGVSYVLLDDHLTFKQKTASGTLSESSFLCPQGFDSTQCEVPKFSGQT